MNPNSKNLKFSKLPNKKIFSIRSWMYTINLLCQTTFEAINQKYLNQTYKHKILIILWVKCLLQYRWIKTFEEIMLNNIQANTRFLMCRIHLWISYHSHIMQLWCSKILNLCKITLWICNSFSSKLLNNFKYQKLSNFRLVKNNNQWELKWTNQRWIK